MKHVPMPFWAEDWLTSQYVSAMELEVQGAYFRLLCFCWLDPDCGISKQSFSTLSGLLPFCHDDVNAKIEVIASHFVDHPTIEGKVTNEKLYQLHLKDVAFHEKKSKSGSLGGLAKAKQTPSKALANVYPPSPSPSPINIKDLETRDPSSTELAPISKPKRKKPVRTDPAQIVLDHYYDSYLAKHGQPPQVAWKGKDRQVAESLLSGPPARTTEAVCALIDIYLSDLEKFSAEKGWPLYLLPSQANRLQKSWPHAKTPEENAAEARALGYEVYDGSEAK